MIKVPDQTEILEHYGNMQHIIWLEESIEVIKAICCQSRCHIVEEVADVIICLEQMRPNYFNTHRERHLHHCSYEYEETFLMDMIELITDAHQLISKCIRYGFMETQHMLAVQKLTRATTRIIKYYDIADDEINKIIDFKYNRELERMKE